MTGAVRWMSANTVMNGADAWAIRVSAGWVATVSRRRKDFSWLGFGLGWGSDIALKALQVWGIKETR